MPETAEASTVSPPAPTQVFIPPSNLPSPKALIFDDNLTTAWKSWQTAWQRYEIATGVHKQEGIVRVSTWLSIIGEDGVKAHDTFTWNEDKNADDISQVLKKFANSVLLEHRSYTNAICSTTETRNPAKTFRLILRSFERSRKTAHTIQSHQMKYCVTASY